MNTAIIKVLTDIIGIVYEGRGEYIAEHVRVGDHIRLKHDAHNSYDEHAVEARHGKQVIGYISREHSERFAEALKSGNCCGEAVVCEIGENYITVYTEMKMPWLGNSVIRGMYL